MTGIRVCVVVMTLAVLCVKEVPQVMATKKTGVSVDLSYGLTEAYAADRFARAYGDRLRYDHKRKLWFVYRAPLWQPDPDGQVWRCALESARTLQAEAERIKQESTKKTVMSFCKYQQSEPGVRHMLKLAMSLPPLANKGGLWDLDPWRLGVSNGVIDLHSGRLRKGRPEDLLTLSAGVPYDTNATCSRWVRFLDEVFCGNKKLVRYIHRCVGYTLTGLTTEQVWWLLHGTGSNGKSVFLEVLAYVLGSYTQTISFQALTLPQRKIPDELAGLPGRRFVFASEAIEGVRLNEARIKSLTGSDRMAARHLFGRWFEFYPQLKLWLTCNHMPTVQDTSMAFWRRPQVVRFERTFDKKTRDRRLVEALKAEGPGILRWAVLGCRGWAREGLDTPDVVTAAKEQYRRDSDQVGQFVAECCEVDPETVGGATPLYEGYQKWARDRGDRGEDVLTQTMFGLRMRQRFERKHTNAGEVYVGVRLR